MALSVKRSGSQHSLPPLPSCRGYLSGGSYCFYPIEPSGLSEMGGLGGPGAWRSWLGCGLGRPVQCSSALGAIDVAAPRPLGHLTSIFN